MPNNQEDNEWKIWAIIIGSAFLVLIIAILMKILFWAGLVGVIIGIILMIRAYEEGDNDLGWQGVAIFVIGFLSMILGNEIYSFLESSGALQYMKDIFNIFRS